MVFFLLADSSASIRYKVTKRGDVVKIADDSWECHCMVRDGSERWLEKSKDEAVSAMIKAAKTLNGVKIDHSDIKFFERRSTGICDIAVPELLKPEIERSLNVRLNLEVRTRNYFSRPVLVAQRRWEQADFYRLLKLGIHDRTRLTFAVGSFDFTVVHVAYRMGAEVICFLEGEVDLAFADCKSLLLFQGWEIVGRV
jgi:hypothetical protein